MKTLVAYYSRSGNTGKVAAAIYEEACQTGKADLKKIETVDPGGLDDYDVVIVGSPLHAGSLAGPVRDFLGDIRMESGRKLACFVTHAAPAYPDQDLEKFTEPVRSACRAHGLTFAGSFTCQGFLEGGMHEMIRSRQGVSAAEWAKKVEIMEGHPDEKDLDNARSFARSALGE